MRTFNRSSFVPAFSSFAVILVLLSGGPAIAQTYCAANFLAPITGTMEGTGATNVQIVGDAPGPTIDDVRRHIEARTLNWYYATGAVSASMTLINDPVAEGGMRWHLVIDNGPGGVFDGEGTADIAMDQPLCPSGYQRNTGTYNGVPNQIYCTLVDPELQNCPTAIKPAKNRGQCGNTMRGNPCNVATGAKYQREVDFSINGLEYARHYNSDVATPAAELGPHWRDDYDRTMVFSTDASIAPVAAGTELAMLYRPDGKILTFVLAGSTITPRDPDTVEVLQRIDAKTWTLTGADDSVETYKIVQNSSGTGVIGRVTSIKKRGGLVLTIAYAGTSGSRASTVTNSFGHKLTFTYTSGKITKLTDPNGQIYTYQYGTGGRLTAVLQPDATPTNLADNLKRQYQYNDAANPGALTAIVDETGATFATWTYDASRRVTVSQRAGGADRVDFAYNPDGTTTVTDIGAASRNYAFALSHGVRRGTGVVTGPTSESKTFNASGFLQSRVDRNGVQTTYTVDARGLETASTEAFGTPRARSVSTTWHPTLRVPTLIVEPGRSTAFTYDTNGNVLTRTVTDTATSQSRTWTRTYNGFGRILTENGPRTDVSDITTNVYYTCTTGGRCGQVQTSTNSLGHVTTFNTYNANGQPLTITDANGAVTTLAYDLLGRITSQNVAGQTTLFTYWPAGMLKRVTSPDASFFEYSYDAAHRPTQVTDNLGNRINFTLDARGQWLVRNAYDPSNSLRQSAFRTYNTLNQLWKTIAAANTPAVTTVFGYDPNGNPTSSAAPMSRTTTSVYDELNRLSQLTDPATGLTQLGYDANDNLTSVLDPKGLTTTYSYNGFGDQLTQVSPDTGSTTSTYDSAGNLATATDARGAVATYTYDSLNRVTQVAYGDQTIAYGYDAGTNGKGRLTSASDAVHAMSWTYDSLGRVTGKGQTVGGTTKSIGYGYLSGRLATMTLPSGQVIAYSYNLAGQVTGVSVGATTILSGALYEPFGPVRQWTWGNSTLAVRTYDTDYKVTQIDSGGFNTLGYDNAFRITSITDAGNANLSWTYGYDSLDRLTSAASTPTTRGWTYDANGNRLTETGSAPSTFTYSVSPSSNRVATVSGSLPRTYSYDAAGNTAGFAGATFTYNNRGRMATATYSGTTATYVYNALGQRIRRVVPSATTLYVYDEAGHIVGEYDAAGALIQETVWMGDIPVATLRPKVGGGVDEFYVHTDHLNTPRVITQPSNNAERWRWDSDPFGTNLPNSNPAGSGTFVYNLRFPGQQYDGLVGLHYNYFRDYDASVGRYVESDPIGLRGGHNTYAYVLSNPLSRIDPRGLQTPALCLNPANATACAAAGEISEGTAAAVAAAARRSAARAAAILLGYAAGRDICKDKDEDCTAEIEGCSELCAAAQGDPDRKRFFGGSMTQCMKNCLPERCGGEPKWKGFK